MNRNVSDEKYARNSHGSANIPSKCNFKVSEESYDCSTYLEYSFVEMQIFKTDLTVEKDLAKYRFGKLSTLDPAIQGARQKKSTQHIFTAFNYSVMNQVWRTKVTHISH